MFFFVFVFVFVLVQCNECIAMVTRYTEAPDQENDHDLSGE